MVFNLRTFSFTESVEGDLTPPKSFSLKEIRVATDNFSRNNFLTEGVNYEVYRGLLADGSLVAVKRACCIDQWMKELFEAEMQVGSTVSTHPNVLCLRGFCRTKKELLLVYPLMINNSLSYNLTERLDQFARPLDWTTRKRIALGAARGLAHLHNQGNIKIAHRDICTTNILLNVHFEAVIGGFSLAVVMHERNVEENSAHSHFHRFLDVCEYVSFRGTPGFIAPETFDKGKWTLKFDVFAYGVMLLELISGQRVQPSYRQIWCVEDWTRKHMNGDKLGRVIDPDLQGNYVEEEAERLVRLALLCAQEDPSVRPEMSEVVRRLESQFLKGDPSSRSSWSQSECDSTPYSSFPPSPSSWIQSEGDSTPYCSFPPSPSPLGIAP